MQACTRRTDQVDDDLDHIDLNYYEMLCRIYTYNTDPTQETCPTAVDHADYTYPILQDELHPTDQECICPQRARS